MKTRSGFISNSSSASFIIDKRYISVLNLQKIKAFCENVGEKKGQCWDRWNITDEEEFVNFWTLMDNGYLEEFMQKLNLSPKAIVGRGE